VRVCGTASSQTLKRGGPPLHLTPLVLTRHFQIENDLTKLNDSVAALKKQKTGLAEKVEAAKDGKESTVRWRVVLAHSLQTHFCCPGAS
jgi:hypothetical protein